MVMGEKPFFSYAPLPCMDKGSDPGVADVRGNGWALDYKTEKDRETCPGCGATGVPCDCCPDCGAGPGGCGEECEAYTRGGE